MHTDFSEPKETKEEKSLTRKVIHSFTNYYPAITNKHSIGFSFFAGSCTSRLDGSCFQGDNNSSISAPSCIYPLYPTIRRDDNDEGMKVALPKASKDNVSFAIQIQE